MVPIAPGVEEKIVELMLGARIEDAPAPADHRPHPRHRHAAPRAPHPRVGQQARGCLLRARQRRGPAVVALEGQGQDELFAALSGSTRPTAGAIEVDGRPVRFAHPADAIREGIGLVPGDRAEAC